MELDWVTFTLELVNFLVLIWILQHFLYRPVLATLAKRKAMVENTLADARVRQTEAQTLEQQFRDRLSAWEAEKQALRAQAQIELERERVAELASLQQSLAAEREKHRALEAHAAQTLAAEHEAQAAQQGAQFASKLLERVASPALEAQLVTVALEDLAKLPPVPLATLPAAAAADPIKIKSAFALSAEQRAALQQRLAATLGPSATVIFTEDAALLAGLRIEVGALVLHANLQDELTWFAEAAHAE